MRFKVRNEGLFETRILSAEAIDNRPAWLRTAARSRETGRIYIAADSMPREALMAVLAMMMERKIDVVLGMFNGATEDHPYVDLECTRTLAPLSCLPSMDALKASFDQPCPRVESRN